ncbi:E3 ubiquitin-protein ligase SGR9, amyloplastic [Mercurialis annua]|uniref:E3 ubiquitin-protein ligase SGR9, amyloplastic n=1 Tax=Mercurialis annua TaxID=3986 RepID=UPI00215DD645|nr:E3 ubiquitin-protein ligase SGR9, amyloplastic [Mercurialis annua]
MAEETVIMSALSTLTPSQLSDLTHSILSQTLHHHHCLSSLLSRPASFSLALHHLHTLSLSNKTLLIAKHLLSSLHHLTRHFHSHAPTSIAITHRDLDAALLLLLLCDVHQQNPEILKAPHDEWRHILSKRCSHTILMQSSIGVYYGGVLLPYVEMIIRCRKFVTATGCCGEKEVAAAPSAVVSLPTVEVKVSEECAICKEEMKEGRDVCKLPCNHLFHWICILPWLNKRNTCPCCRFQLPTQDLLGEIERLWGVLVKAGGGSGTLT